MSVLSFFGIRAERDPTSGFWYGPVGRKTTGGVVVNEHTAQNYSGAWACTRLLCATGSSMPLNMMRRNGKQNREVAEGHPVQRILHNEFNPEMGAMTARAFGINMQVNWGNFYAEIVRGVGGVKELWPIHSSRVEVRRFDDNSLGYRVRNEDGSTDDFTREEMFHVPSIISSNGIQGKGVIQNARESIGAALATEQHGASFFGNGAMPGIIIKGGKFKTKEDREDYRRQWTEVHGGPDRHHRPALLPEGADVAFLQFNARDSQFLELREHNINEMCRWYGVPPHMVYDLRRATYSNIEHQGIDYVVYSQLPWMKLWEEEIWRKLLTPAEQKNHFAKHSVEGLLRGDSAARAAFYKALFEIGVLSINDILELEDRNGIGEDGDKRFVPLNMTTIEKAGTIEDAPEGETEQGISEVEEAKIRMDAYGVGVRAGAITPQTDDEEQFRQLVGLPGLSEDAKKAWADDKGVRRPITLRDPNAPASPFGQPKAAPDDDEPDEAMAKLVEYVASPIIAGPDTEAIVSRAREVLSETVGRMLHKESRACESAAKNNKTPKDFYAWLDDYYDRYGATLAEAIGKQCEILLLAMSDSRETATVVASVVLSHVTASKEDVLRATEVSANEWASVPARIAACGQRWQTERTTISLGA
jgi:HK97 family phage portal protein